MNVTVVIPTYGRGAAIAPTLESALGQEGVDVEVIVVEDAKGDGTRAELEAFVSDRVRILDMPRNGGASAARNLATGEVRTEFVAYLDDDDVWRPNHLRSVLGAMQAAGARWGYGGVTWVDGDLRVDHDQELVAAADVPDRLFEGQVLVTPSAVVVERALLEEVGGWDPAFRVMGDWDLLLRLAARSSPAGSGAHSVLYVRHDGALSATGLEHSIAELPMIVERHGRRVQTGSFWRWLAYTARNSGDARTAARLFARAGIANRDPKDLARAVRLTLSAR